MKMKNLNRVKQTILLSAIAIYVGCSVSDRGNMFELEELFNQDTAFVENDTIWEDELANNEYKEEPKDSVPVGFNVTVDDWGDGDVCDTVYVNL